MNEKLQSFFQVIKKANDELVEKKLEKYSFYQNLSKDIPHEQKITTDIEEKENLKNIYNINDSKKCKNIFREKLKKNLVCLEKNI
jgi:hypothetical protein